MIARLLATATVGEKVAPVEIFQQARCFLVLRQRDRLGLGNREGNRGKHEHALVFRSCAVENLAGEVLKYGVLALSQRLVKRGPGAAQMLAQHHQRRHPSVAVPLDALQIMGFESAFAEYRLSLFSRAAQSSLVDPRDAATRDEPRELGRRIAAPHDDDGDSFGDFLQPLGECGAPLGLRRRLVKVVEDDNAGVRQHRKKIPKEAAAKPGQVLLRLGGEDGKGGCAFSGELHRGEAHVMHERRVSASPTST